ncbi:DUF6387 family protein [Raoultella sp. T31]|uniref:DUF6387 family protein n=1 Tax=Raoultella sp. T31 TaxID=2054594 RepID=UPI000C28FA6C|nr:hypothetical protein CWM52_11890 [Raoultella sp. T31]
MKRNLRSADEIDQEIDQVSKTITEGYDFFNYLRGFDFGVKDVLSSIHVNKYDESTQNYDGLQFYIAFKKRVEMIHSLEYARYLEGEEYKEYLDGYTEDDLLDEMTPFPLSEKEFHERKKDEIKDELLVVSNFLEEIFYGDALAITNEDLRHVSHWHCRSGIVLIDMPQIAFMNRYNGFMGGLGNKEYNKMISDVILNDSFSDSVSDVRKIENGYGWEAGPLSRNTVWAEVDLSVPDEILIEGFKTWIFHARKAHEEVFGDDSPKKNIKNHFKLSLLKRWKSLRVLAYLDMKILSDFFNQCPTLKQYGDALYYDEFDVDTTEKVRKTLIPLVQDILDGNSLEHLLSKILAEEKIPR